MNNIIYDETLIGMTTKWDGSCETGAQIEMAVRTCLLHHERNARWNFPRPKLVPVFIKNIKDLPQHTRLDLLTPGAEVELRIRASDSEYDVQVLSVKVQKSTPLLNFLRSVSGLMKGMHS